MAKLFHANINQKKARVAKLSENLHLRSNKFTRNKDVHYTMIKVSVHQEDMAIPNVYTPTTEVKKMGNKN